jgi:hypothetical protein
MQMSAGDFLVPLRILVCIVSHKMSPLTNPDTKPFFLSAPTHARSATGLMTHEHYSYTTYFLDHGCEVVVCG